MADIKSDLNARMPIFEVCVKSTEEQLTDTVSTVSQVGIPKEYNEFADVFTGDLVSELPTHS